jgi:hypothetical protein
MSTITDKEMETTYKDKADLYWALRTRVLTSWEMDRVREYGNDLVRGRWDCGNETEFTTRLNSALLLQFSMRLAIEARR